MTILDGIFTLDELTLENRRVLVRADLAGVAPGLENLALRRLLPTLEYAMSHEARVVIAAHVAEDGEASSSRSLESFGARLSEATGWEVFLPDDCISDAAKRVIMDLRGNQICLLENLMFHPEERSGDESFARTLAAFADVYVNEAFVSSRHRFTSLTRLPRLILHRGAGLSLAKELMALERVKNREQQPTLFMLGGAVSNARLDVVEALLPIADKLLLGAELGRLFLAARGMASPSAADESVLARARSIFASKEERFVLPKDFVLRGLESPDDMVVKPTGLTSTSELLDVGPESVAMLSAELKQAKVAVLNGNLHAGHDALGSSTLGACEGLIGLEQGLVIGADALLSVQPTYPDLHDQVAHLSIDEKAAFDWLTGKRFFGIEALTGASNE